MIILAVILKIIFHHMEWLAKILPESCVLIIIGILVGTFVHYVILDDILHIEDSKETAFPKFTATLFFNVLLPPIILDAALALYDNAFFDNFASIIIFAVFGTLFNTFSIGYTLYGLASFGVLGPFTANVSVASYNMTVMSEVLPLYEMREMHLQPSECLIFSSLISAVDPVAVLAIFEDLNVNVGLYFLVFGESLFNDGVTVVLYNTFIALQDIEVIGALEIIMAHLSFLCVVLGGALIGLSNALFASYVTTFTQHVRVVEPLVLYSFAYMSFLAAEVFHWSGIISIIAYGITIKRYGFQNVSKKSYTTIKYSIKTLASTSDCIIFLFLGLELIQQHHHFHVGFITATIILCLVFRFISTFTFAFIVNLWRKDQIDLKSQFIMAYGGLRGAVGFSLVVVLKTDLWYRELFVTACLAMVFFTVFLQGATIKLFVKLFHIQLQEKGQKRICNDVQTKLMTDIMEGVGAVVGRQKVKNGFYDLCRSLDKAFKAVLIRDDCKQELQRKFEKIMLDDHLTNLYAPRIIAKQTTAEADQSLDKKPVSFIDTRKSFKQGVKSSNWANFKKMALEDPRYSERTQLGSLLDSRRERAQRMESKVLEGWGEEELPDSAETESIGSVGRLRSKSMSKGLPKKASKNSGIIKAHYDAVQQRKKANSRQGSIKSGTNLAVTFEDEEDQKEGNPMIPKRRHATMPESIV